MSAKRLDAKLMEAFVLAYLHPKFDHPAKIPDFHRIIWGDITSGHNLVAEAAPRGFAKSTCVTHSYSLATCLFGEQDFGVIFSYSWDIATKFLKDIRNELVTNEDINTDFGPIKFIKDTEDEIIVDCMVGQFCLMARGTDQSVRGLKWNRKRPNFMIFDDPEGDEQVASADRRAKFRSRVLEVFIPMGAKELQVIWIDTVKHFDSMLERLLHDDMWLSRRFQAHKSFDDFSELLWPDYWPEERLRDKRQLFINQGNENGYAREYLNIPMTEKGAFFRPNDSLPITDQDRERLDGMTYIAAADFAFSTTNRADYTVMGVAGIDSDGKAHIVEVVRERMPPNDTVDEMIRITKRYKLHLFGVGKGKDWLALQSFLEERMRSTNVYVPIYEVQDTKDKAAKAQTFRGFHRLGMVKFDKEAPWWLTIDDEMRKFTSEGSKAAHDDVVDMLGILGQCMQQAIRPDSDDEIEEEDFLASFRHSGGNHGRNEITGY